MGGTLDQQSPDEIITSMENMLDTELVTRRKDVIDEKKVTLTTEISVIKLQYDQELDEVKGRVHTLEVENKSLIQKVTKPLGETQTIQDNINSDKIQSADYAQYVCSTKIIMYSVKGGGGGGVATKSIPAWWWGAVFETNWTTTLDLQILKSATVLETAPWIKTGQ